MWLYDMAEYRDKLAKAKPKTNTLLTQPKPETNLYWKSTSKMFEIKDSDDFDEEDSNFGPKNFKDLQKAGKKPAPKKPAASNSEPQLRYENTMTKAQKEQERQRYLKAMEDYKM